MPRRCGPCDSPQVSLINLSIEAGESLADLARAHGFSPDAMERHSKHLKRRGTAQVTSQPDGDVEKWLQRVETAYRDAVKSGDVPSALRSCQQAMRALQARADASAKSVGTSVGGSNRSQPLTIEGIDAMVSEYLEKCCVKRLCVHCGGTGKIDVPNFDSRGVLIEKGDSAHGNSNQSTA